MKKAWDFIKSPGAMAALAVVGFALAIYTGFFFERRGQLAIAVEPPSRVFDVHRPIGGLEVSYAGENLRSAKKTLWLISAVFKNVGNAEIKKGDYDEQAPIGLRVQGGEIVDSPSLRTSVAYLQENLKLKSDRHSVLLSPVILEPDDTVQMSVLVLGSESAAPAISALGKLAGARSISVTEGEGPGPRPSVWNSITQTDNWWVHPARLIVYVVGAFLTLLVVGAMIVAFVAPIDALLEKRRTAERRAQMDNYGDGEVLTKSRKFLRSVYVQHGAPGLNSLWYAVKALQKRAEVIIPRRGRLPDEDLASLARQRIPLPFGGVIELERLVEAGLLDPNTGMLTDEQFPDELTRMFSFIGIDPQWDGHPFAAEIALEHSEEVRLLARLKKQTDSESN